jgi:hypothetical protein
MRSMGGASRTFELPAIARQLVAAVWSANLLLLLVVAAWLLARRASGALASPLSAGNILATAGALTFVLLGLTRLAGNRHRWLLAIIILAAAIALAAVTLPGTSAWAVGTVWFMLAGTGCGTVTTRLRPPRVRPAGIAVAAASAIAAAPSEATEESISDALVQQLTRQQTKSGGESIHAILRAACEPGDSRVVVHLAFCPPLAKAPKLAAYPLDESGAEASTTVAETYGARIELRLPRPAAAGEHILLEVVGEAAGDSP